mgnify:CR=1 FL=1
MRQIILLLVFLFLIPISQFTVDASSSKILVVELSGTIDQSALELVNQGIREARDIDAEVMILILNTPGGGLKETFDIVESIQESSIPIVGYVYPEGSAAWSAGTFILLNTHIAAMADHTVIGSCQPVEITMSGAQPVNDSKTINALVGWIKERAAMYGRNSSAAELFIIENLNVNASQAYKMGVIEVVASNLDSLLDGIDGHTVNTSIGMVTIHTRNASIVWFKPSIGIQFLKIVSDPMITSLLFMLGVFALIFGISVPGHGAEVFGVIAILLSLLGSGFNVSNLSIIFIILGSILLLIELLVIPGFGIVGIGGLICIFIGSILLIPTYTPPREWIVSAEWVNTFIVLILVATALIAVFFLFLLYKVLQIRKKKKVVGVLIGETAVTVDPLQPGNIGFIRFKSELWQAKSDVYIPKDTKVVIVEKDGIILKVKPFEQGKQKLINS